ncbi:DUF2339 domain-containing protein [Sphingobium sufflavum]|uniref:DUF2339 domain-containing protein n=1 Tax=Sphingobium sufflavum TaxID=1129547 RepID=UPI001F38F676|nr:DUF2339 domain-containing protein [Sphingobium sufflavum]MCE7796910.1 DUF2339 domain-containing protein [Sphingobium sufflavum]
MEAMLFIAIIVLGVLLFDARSRLKRVEERLAEDRLAEDRGARMGASPWDSRASASASGGPARIRAEAVPAPDQGGVEPLTATVAGVVASPPVPEDVDPLRRKPATIVDEAAPAGPVPVGPGIVSPVQEAEPASMENGVPPAEGISDGAASPADAVAAGARAMAQERQGAAAFAGAVDARAPTPLGAGAKFEDLFGRKLPIWAGGITLAVAGVLLVKYSIDAGLLSPVVRVVFGLLFGAGLIAGAEVALRQDARVGDPRVRQALSGAGIATLYAAIVAAANLYALIGPATAFVGLALVTALAMALSVRFGAPSAILGLVGGMAAPALVGEGPPNVPLLSAYLALAIGGLTTLSRRQKWAWLGVGALVGGAGWGGILLLTGALDFATSLSLGLLLLLLGVGLPAVAFSGARATVLRMGAAVVAAAQIAALVAKGGFEPLVWAFYLLLAGAMVWLAWREERFRPLPPVGLTIGLLLAALWPQPPMGQFAAVLLALGAIHAGPALWRLWRAGGSMIEAGQVMGFALAGHAITLFHYHAPGGARDGALALLAIAAAALPALGAGLGWTRERGSDARFAGLVLASALLLAVAALIGLPHWLVPVGLAVLAGGLVLLARAAGDRRVEQGVAAFLAAAVLALLITAPSPDEWGRLGGEAGNAPVLRAVLRWGVVALAAGLAALRLTVRSRGAVALVAAVMAYGTVAQVVPVWSLPLVASLGALGVALAGRRLADAPWRFALGGFGGIALLWAIWPFAQWAGFALVSLVGEPMLVTGLPSVVGVVTRLGVPAGVVLFLLWRGFARVDRRADRRMGRVGVVAVGLVGVAAAHGLYKHLFALGDMADVVRLGLAERIVWEAVLLGIGVAVWRWRGLPLVALAGAGAAVAHGVWYGLILFNPLTRDVAVGPWPVANLLLPAFAVLFAGLWVIERTLPQWQAAGARINGVARMILIPLFAYASLRQLFCGSLLVGTPVGGVESIGVSVLAIGIAVGFLLWGIRSGRHDWRIGSLILMLAAVAKVFLMDAAGLEGLLRIASFLALGFSLIGIGWLYSRFLRSDQG